MGAAHAPPALPNVYFHPTENHFEYDASNLATARPEYLELGRDGYSQNADGHLGDGRDEDYSRKAPKAGRDTHCAQNLAGPETLDDATHDDHARNAPVHFGLLSKSDGGPSRNRIQARNPSHMRVQKS